MFDLFVYEKPKPTLRLKVSYHRFFEGDVVVVWVNQKAIDHAHAKNTINFLQKHFNRHHVVIASFVGDNKPVYLSKGVFASKFGKYSFEDFSWSEYKIELDDKHKYLAK